MKEEPQPEDAKPWGRFTLVSKDPAEDSDHIYFSKKETTIGRNKRRADVVLDKLFISSVHCSVILDGTDDKGEPQATLCDNSRNGIWVNADRVGKGSTAKLGNGFTVHFTKPGVTPAGVTPMIYKLEFLNLPAPTPKSEMIEKPLLKSEAVHIHEDTNMTVVVDESFEATQLTIPDDPPSPSPSEKKRKRGDEEPVCVTVATQELQGKLMAVESELEAVKNKLKTAESERKAAETKLHAAESERKAVESKLNDSESQVAALTEELQQTMQIKVPKLAQENLNLMSKAETATAETLKLKNELAAKNKEAEQKIKEAVKKSLETEREAKAQEMATKLKDVTLKYQQKVKAEHFEQRRELSEKMAEFANENDKLQTKLGTKEEELAECEDKIASLREKVASLEKQTATLSEKEKKLEESQEKIAELEEKINSAKDENSEILGLLATAEEKVIVAENKAAEATIAASAAISGTNGADLSERHELQAAITSLRKELETYRAELAKREEEIKEQQKAVEDAASAATATTVSPPNVTAESIAQDDDAEGLRARLAAALNLFGQVQALGLQGMSLITGTETQDLGDLHLLSVASERTSIAVPNSPASSPTEADQENSKPGSESGEANQDDGMHDQQDDKSDQEGPPVVSGTKTENKSGIKTKTKKVADADANEAEQATPTKSGVNGVAAEPKASLAKSKWEKKRSNKQPAPLSAAIEADAVSAIAAMAAAESSAKSSPSDASTAVANGDGEGDWEMLE